MTHPHDWITLSLLPGLGPGGLKKLLAHFGTPQQLLKASNAGRAAVTGLRAGQLDGFNLLDQCSRQAEQQLTRLVQLGGRVLCYDEPEYPEPLRQIPDPPFVLYAQGDISLLERSSVAIVGSRSATAYGRRTAGIFAEHLVAAGVTVVSGLALGIDSEAHRGALRTGGNTIAVLGCGLDVVYPKQNQRLYGEIAKHGLLLSEYPLGTSPEGFRFPARNRIIAGLSRGVVVVEAARKSGSLITAQLALDFNREIFAVPGQVDSYKSEGAHWLLRQGAQLAVSAADILEELRFAGGNLTAGKNADDPNLLSELDPNAVALLHHLESYPLTRDEVLEKTDLSPAGLSELFLYLELEGHIEVLAGDRVRRLH